ncbi:hypothetical protein TorRG33x02_151220 [Trema orientale]|uniref:Uncharacterized protein n=1 Tax=Trema orientale TaxID=63057 RepID=A0A2P5EU55_TREOI|nr:hypothetical protein TorRG33x02_151220 [Trema orientale]
MFLVGEEWCYSNSFAGSPKFSYEYFQGAEFSLPRTSSYNIEILVGASNRERKIAWVNQDQICRPKGLGGLGFAYVYQTLVAKESWDGGSTQQEASRAKSMGREKRKNLSERSVFSIFESPLHTIDRVTASKLHIALDSTGKLLGGGQSFIAQFIL